MKRIAYCPVVGRQCSKIELEIEVQKDTFFLAEPFRPAKERKKRERAVRSALKEALGEKFSENALKIADKEPKETAIFCDICRMIQSSAYGIVDISGLNSNVLVELGMMFALGKPVFILVNESEEKKLKDKIPSDIVWKRVIPYGEFIDIEEGLSRLVGGRPQVEPEPSLIKKVKEVSAEVDPALVQKIDEKLIEIKMYQEKKLDRLEELLVEVRTDAVPHENENVDSLLKKQILDIYEDVGQINEELMSPKENSEAALSRINWDYHRKEYERALEFYELSSAYKGGLIFDDIGRYEEAIACYNKVLEIDQNDEAAWNNKGTILSKLGGYEEAIACYNKAIEIKEDLKEAWNNKGTVFSKLGRYKEAIACFNKALKLNSGYLPALMNLSENLLILGELSKGLEMAQKAFNLAEETEERVISLFLCISAYLLGKRREEARKEMKRIVNYLRYSEEEFKMTEWDFYPLLHVVGEKLDEENRERLSLLVSLLRGEIELQEFEESL